MAATRATAGALAGLALLTACGSNQIKTSDAAPGAPLPALLEVREGVGWGTTLTVYGTDNNGNTLRYGTLKEKVTSFKDEVDLVDVNGTERAKGVKQLRVGSTVDDFTIHGENGAPDRVIQMRKETWDSILKSLSAGGDHKAGSVFVIKENGKAIGVSEKNADPLGGAASIEVRNPITHALMGSVVRESGDAVGDRWQIDDVNIDVLPIELLAEIAGFKTTADNNDSH